MAQSIASVLHEIDKILDCLPAQPRTYLWMSSYECGPVTVHYHYYDMGVTVHPLFDPEHQEIYELAYRIPLLPLMGCNAGKELLTQEAFVLLTPFIRDEFLRKQTIRFNAMGEVSFPHKSKEVEEYVESLSWDNIDQATTKLAYQLLVKRNRSYVSMPDAVVDPIIMEMFQYMVLPVGDRIRICDKLQFHKKHDCTDKDTIYLSQATAEYALKRNTLASFASLCKVVTSRTFNRRYTTDIWECTNKVEFQYFIHFRSWPYKKYLPFGISSVNALKCLANSVYSHLFSTLFNRIPYSAEPRHPDIKESLIARIIVLKDAKRTNNDELISLAKEELKKCAIKHKALANSLEI